MTDLTANKLTTNLVDSVYSVLSCYEKPKTLTASPLRRSPILFENLIRIPLRELTVDSIGIYTPRAVTTVGTIDNFRYFLPRILELAIDGKLAEYFGAETIAQKLRYSKWKDWPIPEQSAIGAVFLAAFRNALQSSIDDILCDSWLCACLLLRLKLSEVLLDWSSLRSPESTSQLVNFVANETNAILHCTGYWREVDALERQNLVDWIWSSDVELAVIEGIEQSDKQQEWLFDSALSAIAWARTSD